MQTLGAQLQSTTDQVWGYLPTLLAAIGILVLGWIAALFLGTLVRRAVSKVVVEKRFGGWVRGDHSVESVDVAGNSGRAAFWLGMLFVLVAFFQVLQLSQVTQPLNALLGQVAAFLPRIMGAALLLLIAWLVASALRRLVRVILRRARFDERLALKRSESGGSEGVALSGAASDAVYWLVLLLFLPGILGALSIQGMMEPLQAIVAQVLGFLPRLVGAGLILTIGWLVARFVRGVLRNLLAATGADELGERAGILVGGRAGGLSHLASTIVYALILIPVVVSSLNALELTAVTAPASAMLERIMGAVPAVFAASLMLGFAYIVGRFVADLLGTLLEGLGFNRLFQRLGLAGVVSDAVPPADLAAKLAMVAIMFFAAMEASSVLGLDALTNLLQRSVVFGGHALFALLILALGFYFAGLAQEAIRSAARPVSASVGVAARVGIIAIAAAMALQQLNVGTQLITVAFAAVFGGAAIAAAIAFGLGGREAAAGVLHRWLPVQPVKTSAQRPASRE